MLEIKEKLNGTESECSEQTSNGSVALDEENLDPLYRGDPLQSGKELSVESILTEFRNKKTETDEVDVDDNDLSEEPEILSPEELTAQLRVVQAEVKELRTLLDDKPKIRGEPKQSDKKKRRKFAWIFDVAFYLLIVAVVLGAFLVRSSSGGKPFSFAGYSAFTVLTSSMEDVIPKGSLVITKSVDANTLQIGDDITFMSGPTSTITHRIVDIEEKYAETGERAFKTKGTMNKQEDDWVPAVNVVGKVVYHNKTIGDAANFIKTNWPFVLFVVIVLVVLFYVLKRVFREDNSDDDSKPRKKKDETKIPQATP